MSALLTLELMRIASGVRFACTRPAFSCRNSKALLICNSPF